MRWRTALARSGALVILSGVMAVLFSVGSAWLGPQMADSLTPEQANFAGVALLVVCVVDTLLFGFFILFARLSGWRLMIVTGLTYYVVKTFQANIEALYFMNNLTAELIPRLFAMTLPVALVWPPLAVWLLGKGRPFNAAPQEDSPLPAMDGWAWTWKLGVLGVIVYPLLFFTFGYFVAWQNPDVRAFYGGDDPVGFLAHMSDILAADKGLLLFEAVRGVLWAATAALLLWSMGKRPWTAALLLALILALVENNSHLFPNPLMPLAVRQVHFVETASSNFLFGLMAAALLMWRPAPAHRPLHPTSRSI